MQLIPAVLQVLQDRNEALATADRLKADFITDASHELRSPLNAIIEFTEILAQQYIGALNEKQTDYINRVLESSNKLLYLVNDILDLASLEAGHLTLQPHTVDIPTLLKEVTELVSQKTGASSQSFVLNCDKVVGAWNVDEQRLKQALFNLLSNAAKLTPVDGKITIETKITKKELEISVSVTGIGLAHEEQAHLFKNIQRGKEAIKAEGGLELSLVKSLVKLHGGRLQLFSEPNEGSKITCFFPSKLQKNQPHKNRIISEVIADR